MKITDKEILYKAILKAENHGYKEHLRFLPIITGNLCNYNEFCTMVFWEHKEKIIFSKEFAKAFWGEKTINTINWYPWAYTSIEKWRFHLGEMAMHNAPLKYIERFLCD